MHLAAQKICMLVVGKGASTLSTLHGIANCVKNGTRKLVSSNRYQRLARCSVAHIYFRSSSKILFTVVLETKTQLWKLIWAISRCCIGSSGSPMHLSLLTIFFSMLDYTIPNFRRHHKLFVNIQWIPLDFLTFCPYFFCFDSNESLTCKWNLSVSGSWYFIRFNNALVLPDPELPMIKIL